MLPGERVVSVFEGRKPDKMPWMADLTYWYSAQEYLSTLPEKYRGWKGRLRLYKDLGCAAHEDLYCSVHKVRYKNVRITTRRENLPDGSMLVHIKYSTPVGKLHMIRKFSPTSVTWFTIKYPVEKVDDLKILKFIYEDQEVEPNEDAYIHQLKLMEMWEGWGIVSSLPPRSPFARMLIELAGPITTFKLYWKSREELDELIDVMANSDDPIYEAINEAPAKFVYFGENISSDIVSPTIFKRYYLPYYKKRCKQLHAKGKYIYVHIDGRLRGVLPLLKESGVDCAQSLTPAPVGDLPIEEFRKVAGSDIILAGGLPGIYFSKRYSENLLYDMVRKVLECYLSDNKFIMCVADQVPPDGDIKRVKKVSELIEQYYLGTL